MLTLISGTPSPFSRMIRVALHEKGIEFKLQSDVPWNSETQTPQYNPLEKVPILLFDDGSDPVYDSTVIQEYIVQKYPDKGPSLLPGNLDGDLKARQIWALGGGMMDAFVLIFFEQSREVKSQEWLARQDRKIDGGISALEDLVKNRQPSGSDYLLGDKITIADIAVCCAIGQVEFAELRPGWQQTSPNLAAYWKNLDTGRESFRNTRPFMTEIKDKVV